MITDFIIDDPEQLSLTVDALQQIDLKSAEPGSPAWKLRTLYDMGLDFVHRNLQGAHPALGDIVAIYQTPRAGLPDRLRHEAPCEAFIVGWCNPDADYPTLEIGPAPLALGNPELYISNLPEAVEAVKRYDTFLRRLSQLIGNYGPREESFAENVIASERTIADALLRTADDFDDCRLTKMDKGELDAAYPALRPSCILPASWNKADVVYPEVIAAVDRLMATAPEQQLHDYMAARYLMTASACLSDDFLIARLALSGEKPVNRKQLTASTLYSIFGPDIERVASGAEPMMPIEALDVNPRGTYWENIYAAMKLHCDYMTQHQAD